MELVTVANCRRQFEVAARAAVAEPVVPTASRGVVLCGGGDRYFPCLWVNLHRLRQVGCRLPVEVWHLGPGEMTGRMRRLLEPLGATCVDATDVAREAGMSPPAGGYELKAFALRRCRFAEVLLLDADNVVVADPAYLFDTPAYRAAGALFWPDVGRTGPDDPVWCLAGVPYRDEPEFETGQLLVDKRRRGREVALAAWLNEHSYFWYRCVHGDKDTFRLAWRKLGTPYAMAPAFDRLDHAVFCQCDPQGRRVFQHRIGAKWVLPAADNVRVPGFRDEDRCLAALAELEAAWAAGRAPASATGA